MTSECIVSKSTSVPVKTLTKDIVSSTDLLFRPIENLDIYSTGIVGSLVFTRRTEDRIIAVKRNLITKTIIFLGIEGDYFRTEIPSI